MWIASEAALQETAGHECDVRRIRAIFFIREVPSENRMNFECGKKCGCNLRAGQADRRLADKIAVSDTSGEGGNGIEGGGTIAQCNVGRGEHKFIRVERREHTN